MALDLDPGAAALGNPRLVNAIVTEMAGGTIPFERFMELALYHPDLGYYRRPGRIGPQGDFLTSPVVHPMFGWAVAGWCRDLWERLGRPRPFTLFEAGAGTGALATAILDWAEGRGGEFREALRYVAIEPNARGAEPRAEWVSPPVSPASAGVVVANELFDAFPVRLFDATERGPQEIYVRWDGNRFLEAPGPVVTIDEAPRGGRFEVNQHAYPAMVALCRLVERGAVLVFDYGYPREQLWAPWRTQGTLLCFYRHTAHEDPYQHVGEQDLTAHVNFSELAAAAEEAGFTVSGPVSQAAFLAAVGLGQTVEASRDSMAEYFARRRALQTLTDSAGLGRVQVLAALRGVTGLLPGFEEDA
ncbi:MAG: SAM-dependent methyltransferase [Dehalococcoidia bacterium]|nr:SAM-dependent methyltransferase [Dehalococcoidia bacterium]